MEQNGTQTWGWVIQNGVAYEGQEQDDEELFFSLKLTEWQEENEKIREFGSINSRA